MCFQNEKPPRTQASQPCSCPHIIRLLSQEEGVFPQDLEPTPIEDGIVYPEPISSPTLDTRQGPCRHQASLPSECSLMSGGLAPGHPGLAFTSPGLLPGGGEGRQESSGAAARPFSLPIPPLRAFPAVSSRYRHQREGPWEEYTQAAGAPRSTVLTVPALWIIAAAAFPAPSTPMKVRLQPRGRARTVHVVD